MKRVLCAWLPHWPLQRWRAAHEPASPNSPPYQGGVGGVSPTRDPETNSLPPLLLYDALPPRPAWVVAASAQALSRGVHPGMALVEALALVSGHGSSFPQLARHDAAADRRALIALAQDFHRFSPLVSLDDDPSPDSFYLDISGLFPPLPRGEGRGEDKLQVDARHAGQGIAPSPPSSGLRPPSPRGRRAEGDSMGSEQPLAAEVLRSFAERGFTARVAVADTMAAAWAVAHWGTSAAQPAAIVPPGRAAEALNRLPIEALRLPEELTATLRALGLRTIEQAARLPRAALPSRGGQALLDRLDQALGRASETAHKVAPLERWIERRELEFPLERSDLLAAVAEQLLRQLAEPLRRQGLGWWQLKCVLRGEHGPPRVVGLTLFRPSASARYLRELLELRWERLRLAQPITTVEIHGLRSGPLAIRQSQWLADEAGAEIGDLVDRLVSRLGPSAVWTPRLTPEAQPELGYRAQPIGPESSAPKRKKRKAEPMPEPEIVERPLQLLRRPRPLEAIALHPNGPIQRITLDGQTHVVAQCDGPERIETGWHRGPPVRRDYFRVETAAGQRAWVFRDQRQWFLQAWDQ